MLSSRGSIIPFLLTLQMWADFYLLCQRPPGGSSIKIAGYQGVDRSLPGPGGP